MIFSAQHFGHSYSSPLREWRTCQPFGGVGNGLVVSSTSAGVPQVSHFAII
jgi:hypothetical protein